MKHLFAILVSSFSFPLFGQFIPQTMGYNPDANGDEFIGVDDVIGTLALFGNHFSLNDSISSSSVTLSAENMYHTFCTSQFGGGYDCQERACDNFPIEPYTLPVADVYHIHIPSLASDDAPWWPEGIDENEGTFLATLPAVVGFKTILIYFTHDVGPYSRSVRLYRDSDFAQIDFSDCASFNQGGIVSEYLLRDYEHYAISSFYLLLHTPDGTWRKLSTP